MQSLENPTANLPKLSNENELEGGDNNLQNLKNRAGSMMTTIKSPTGDGNSPNLDDIESVYGEDQYEKLDTAWLQEAIEEFDVFVAQRQFKEAADLINTGIEYLTGIRSKVEEGQFKEWAIQYSKRRNELVWVLRKDLMVQTTTRMQRTPCALLVKLMDQRRAAQLFLKARSKIIRQLKPHTGSVIQFIQKLSTFTFTNINETILDFKDIFIDFPELYSLLINNFITVEMKHFAETFRYQVFSGTIGSGSLSFKEATQCFDIALNSIDEINYIDMLFYLGELLRKEIIELVKKESLNILDFLRARLSDESWKVLTDVEKTKDSLSKQGISSTDLLDYIIDDNRVEIASTAVSLTKQLGNYVLGISKIYDPETGRIISSFVVEVWEGVLEQLKAAHTSLPEGSEEKMIAQRSYKFIKKTVLVKFTDKLADFNFDTSALI